MLYSRENITLSTGMSLEFCNSKFISKLLKSAKIPFTLRTSGNLPLYFPDRVNGPFDERSGICEGYTYTKIENNGIREIAIQDQGKLDKNATHTTKKSLPQIHQDHPISQL
jgi:hypothetical protein